MQQLSQVFTLLLLSFWLYKVLGLHSLKSFGNSEEARTEAVKKSDSGGAQWLRICLPIQGTRVRALVGEDPTCRGAPKCVRHNYWACALEPANHNCWSPHYLEPVLHKRSHHNEKPVHRKKSSPCSPQLEKARMQQWRPNAAKINKLIKKKSDSGILIHTTS